MFPHYFCLLFTSGDQGSIAVLDSSFIGLLSDRAVTFRIETFPKRGFVEEFSTKTLKGRSSADFKIPKKGTYRLMISARGMLTHACLLTLSPGKITKMGKVNAFLGDVNGDNYIDKLDIALINNFDGVRARSDRWIFGDLDTPNSGRDCDLNGDNVVDKKDYRIASDNLGKRGSLR